jgi:glycosyltransferase involved in cell wall biosynthesis
MDHYWTKVNRDLHPMRYSDFNIGDKVRTDAIAQADADIWIGTAAERLCRYVAYSAESIVAGLYEYWITYKLADDGALKDKTTYIPFPISQANPVVSDREGLPIKIFVGISKNRSQYKGTDIMLSAAERLRQEYPDRVELLVAEGVPFAQYQSMMDGSDVILDQLYSYTPAMNALLAMSKGIICVGGGEPEHYDLLGEKELRPIVNVEPDEESVYQSLEKLMLHPELVPKLKRESMEYVRRHHDVEKVAKEYEKLYLGLMSAGQSK